MKKGGINLLNYRDRYSKIAAAFIKLRKFVVFYCFFLMIAATGFYFYNRRLISTVQSLETQKNAYLSQIASLTKEEAGLIYLSKKVDLVDKYLNEGAKFGPYYNVLLGIVASLGADSVSFSNFSVDNNRQTTFKLTFNTLESLLEFFKYSETNEFLKNFESLNLLRVASVEKELTRVYEVDLEGKFAAIKDEN